MSNILNIELRDIAPMEAGSYRLPRKFPILEARDGEVYTRYRSGVETGLPQVIARQFLSDARSARIVSIYFSDDFRVSIVDSRWGFDRVEVVGNHNEWYILNLRLSGDTLDSICGQDYRMGASSAYMVHYTVGMSHVLRSASAQPLVEICATFRPSMLERKLGLSRGELHNLLHPKSRFANPWFSGCYLTPQMERAARELRDCRLTEPAYRLYAQAKTLELISLYLSQLRAQANDHGRGAPFSKGRWFLQQVKRYLEEHYDREPQIDCLCRLVGFSRKKLTRSFKSEFGKTIREYHQEVRMEIAKALFRDRSANVSAAAEKIGYAYPGNFAVAFQKYTGMSPSAYIKNHSQALR